MSVSPRGATSRIVLTDFGEVVTNDPEQGGLLGVVENGAIVTDGGTVEWVGPAGSLPGSYDDLPRATHQGMTAIPGFVDAHTHLAFAGHRADEFALRASGASYEEILSSGGGIHSTVAATTTAAPEELETQTRIRLERMLASGTTTVEVKSGYGLSTRNERRLLETVAGLAAALPIEISPTFLGAHAVPPGTDPGDYIDAVIYEMLPECAGLAESCDVFCDEGIFGVEEARRVLEAGKAHGLIPRIHACQLSNIGAAELAAELGAASADHLDHIDRAGVEALAASGTVAVLLPGVSFSLRLPPPPARMLLDAGVTVALATDCNPGTSYVETMSWVIAVAVREMGLSPDEALWSATRGGALALRRPHHGMIAPGSVADIAILDADSHNHLAYRPDADLIQAVYKGGTRVA